MADEPFFVDPSHEGKSERGNGCLRELLDKELEGQAVNIGKAVEVEMEGCNEVALSRLQQEAEEVHGLDRASKPEVIDGER